LPANLRERNANVRKAMVAISPTRSRTGKELNRSMKSLINSRSIRDIRGQKVLLVRFCSESFGLGGHYYYSEVCVGGFAAGEDKDRDWFCSGNGLFGERFFIQ